MAGKGYLFCCCLGFAAALLQQSMISPQKNRKFRKVKILVLCPLSHTCNLISAKMQKVRSVERLGKNISAVLINPTMISETKLATIKEGGNDIRRDVTMTGNPWLK